MSAWAFCCRPCDEPRLEWFVSALDVADLGSDVRIVRVKVGADWKCALLDRSRRVEVDDQLLRTVIAGDAADCPECAELLEAEARSADSAARPSGSGDAIVADDAEPSFERSGGSHAVKVQAAAISLLGRRFVVVVSSMDLVRSPGEATMAIEDLQPYFDDVPILLMAQDDDGSPVYHGDESLVQLVADVPIDRMPWKEYAVG